MKLKPRYKDNSNISYFHGASSLMKSALFLLMSIDFSETSIPRTFSGDLKIVGLFPQRDELSVGNFFWQPQQHDSGKMKMSNVNHIK